jgi:DNA replication initiation complex subunit (GINS family)
MINFEFDWTPIIVGLVAFIVGYLFALLDRRVTQTMQKDKKDQEKDAENKPAPDLSALSITLADQEAHVKLFGTPIEPEQITPEQRKQLIGLLTLIRPLLEGKPAVKAKSTIQAQPKPANPAPQSLAAPAATARPSQPVSKSAEASKSEAPDEPTSIVAQIDAILQRQLAGNPLENRGVRLVESPTGSVTVYVGLDHFDSVDEIPDADVQAAIRTAIAAWEQSIT